MDQCEYASKTNSYLTEYIKFADAKAGAILVLVALVGGVVSVASKSLFSTVSDMGVAMIALATLLALVIAYAVTMTLVHTISALSPKTSDAQGSLNSFPDIAKLQPNLFADQVVAVTAEDIVRNYSRHNHALAVIVSTKFASIGSALKWLRIAILGTYLTAILYAGTGIKFHSSMENASDDTVNAHRGN
jgi:hypothetical protein